MLKKILDIDRKIEKSMDRVHPLFSSFILVVSVFGIVLSIQSSLNIASGSIPHPDWIPNVKYSVSVSLANYTIGNYTFMVVSNCADYPVTGYNKYECAGKTDANGTVVIQASRTGFTIESTCTHELLHNVIPRGMFHDTDEEHVLIDRLIPFSHFDECDLLVDKIRESRICSSSEWKEVDGKIREFYCNGALVPSS